MRNCYDAGKKTEEHSIESGVRTVSAGRVLPKMIRCYFGWVPTGEESIQVGLVAMSVKHTDSALSEKSSKSFYRFKVKFGMAPHTKRWDPLLATYVEKVWLRFIFIDKAAHL